MHGDSFRRRENKSFNEETNRSHFVIGNSKVWPQSTVLHIASSLLSVITSEVT